VTARACSTGDAKRKGKIEQAFRPLKEAFLEELDVQRTTCPFKRDEQIECGFRSSSQRFVECL
jgi:hypothetical protein